MTEAAARQRDVGGLFSRRSGVLRINYLFRDRMHRILAKFGRSNDYSPMTLVEGN